MIVIKKETFTKIIMNLVVAELCLEFDQVFDALKEYASAGIIQLPTKKRIYWIFRLPHVDKYSRERFKIRVRKRIIEIYYQPEGPIFDLLPPGTVSRIRLS